MLIYTSRWCPGCHVAKLYLKAKGVDFQEIDIEEVPAAAEQVRKLTRGHQTVPTMLIGSSVVVDWNQREVDRALVEAGLA